MPEETPTDPPRAQPEPRPAAGVRPTPEQVAACYAELAAVRDPLERRFALLRVAERLEIEAGELESLLADYALSRRTRRGTLERWLYRLARRFEERSFFEILEYVGSLAIVVAIASFLLGIPDSRAQQRVEAWDAVAAGAGQVHQGNRPGLLEWLNRQCFPMEGLEAPGADLRGLRLDGCQRLFGRLAVAGFLAPAMPALFRYEGVRLEGADLSAARLSDAHLGRADLTGTRLGRADLSRADLVEARLLRADLGGARLVGADLEGADLSEADLRGADLLRADLTGAKLHRARLCGARFVGARLVNAELDGAVGCPQGERPTVNFAGADLSSAQLYAADLRGARFQRVRLDHRTWFDDAELSGADFSHVTMPRAGMFQGAASHPDRVSPGGGGEAALSLGLVIPDRHFFFDEVEAGVRRAAAEAAVWLGTPVEVSVHHLSIHAPWRDQHLAGLAAGHRALVVRAPSFDGAGLRAILDTGVTLACYDQCPEGVAADVPYVGSYESGGGNLGWASGTSLARWWRRRAASEEVPPARMLVYRSCAEAGCFYRVRGMREALARHSGVAVGLREEAYLVAAGTGTTTFADVCSLLRDHPGPAVLWTANEAGSEAAVEAAAALGREGEVAIFGIDLTPTLAARLLQPGGALQGVVAQDPRAMGRAAAARAIADASPGRPEPYEYRNTGYRTWTRDGLSGEDRRVLEALAADAPPRSSRSCPPG